MTSLFDCHNTKSMTQKLLKKCVGSGPRKNPFIFVLGLGKGVVAEITSFRAPLYIFIDYRIMHEVGISVNPRGLPYGNK